MITLERFLNPKKRTKYIAKNLIGFEREEDLSNSPLARALVGKEKYPKMNPIGFEKPQYSLIILVSKYQPINNHS